MKTVFKVGMKVYDQVFEPDIKGEVLDVNTEIPHHPITVLFGHNTRYYTAEGCRGQHKIRTLSTSPYTIQGFEQKAPAPTFEEAWEESEKIYEPKSEYNKEEYGGYPTQELADASESLRRLLFLRDYYNEGWQPDWKDSSIKYCIEIYLGEIDIRESCRLISKSFSFKSKEIAEKFLKEQKELLEIAKPLL